MRFTDNGLVTCLRGKEFFQDGILKFSTELAPPFHASVDGHYRTAFGPYIHRNAHIYGNTNHNAALAVQHRLCQSKFPDHPFAKAFETFFFELQGATIERHAPIWTEYFRAFDANFADTVEHALEGFALPHVKRELRIMGMRDLLTTGKIGNNLWLKTIWYKAKSDEWAKAGKPQRFIGDLGVSASLQGFWSTMLLKQYMHDNHLMVNDFEIVFLLHVTTDGLNEAFRNLVSPPTRGYAVLFSDDFTISIRDKSLVHTYNLDIKKCDFSHSKHIFKQLYAKYLPDPLRENMKLLVKQISLPARIHNVANRSEMVMLQRQDPFLYSGATITTVVNTLATGGITIEIALSNQHCGEAIEECGLNMGYQLSGWSDDEKCKTMHDIQFLKHSPVYDVTGVMRGLLNLGVLLRTSGICKGDLPGRGPLEPRASLFQSGILRGMYPDASFELINKMKSQLPASERLSVNYLFDQLGNGTRFHVDMQEATARYRLSSAETEILMVLATAGYGDVLCDPVFHKIFNIDYGYPL
jgi:hypothetical protein